MLDGLLDEELSPEERAQILGTRMALIAGTGQDPTADLDEIERLLAGETGLVAEITRADARANVAFALGDLADASRHLHRTAELSPLNVPYVLPRAARAELWLGDAAAATADLAAFEATGMHGPATPAWRQTIRAGLAALDERQADSAALYRQAIAAWREMGLPWDLAQTAIDMAELLGPDHPDVRAITPEARQILEGLSARPFLTRLDRALASSSHTPTSTVAETADARPATASA
jgi:hypothetical protein